MSNPWSLVTRCKQYAPTVYNMSSFRHDTVVTSTDTSTIYCLQDEFEDTKSVI